jgi:adenylate kinase family enzyme
LLTGDTNAQLIGMLQGRDDETGELLTQRADDVTEAVEHRLQVYHATIQPVLDFYANAKLLQDFKGTESNKIWPEVYKYLATVIQPKLPFP